MAIELTKSAVLDGKDIFTLKSSEVLELLKKHDDSATYESGEVSAPKLGITV